MEKQTSVRLAHKDIFAKLLTNYRPSSEAVNVLRQTDQILLIGPTGSGRNTVISELLKTGKYHLVVSDTTRQPRVNLGVLETNGLQYWFISEEEFIDGLEKGEYIEAAIIHDQQVSGVSIREIIKAAKDNKIAVNEVEIHGAKTYLELSPNVTCIFLLPPTYEVWMDRLHKRGRIEVVELERRLISAVAEIEMAIKNPQFILVENGELSNVVEKVDAIARNSNSDQSTDQGGLRDKAKALLERLKTELA